MQIHNDTLERLRHMPIIALNSTLIPTDVEGNRALAPKFELSPLEGVGHFPQLERPDEFNAAVLAIRSLVRALHRRALLAIADRRELRFGHALRQQGTTDGLCAALTEADVVLPSWFLPTSGSKARIPAMRCCPMPTSRWCGCIAPSMPWPSRSPMCLFCVHGANAAAKTW